MVVLAVGGGVEGGGVFNTIVAEANICKGEVGPWWFLLWVGWGGEYYSFMAK